MVHFPNINGAFVPSAPLLTSALEDKNEIFIQCMLLMQIRQSKEQFNNEVMAMKTRKAMLLQELEDIQLQLIDIQYRLDASKRKPVPTIPIIYPEERHQDPFHVSF